MCCLKDVDNVCLRCCCCVSLEMQLLHVWLPKKRDLLFMGPVFSCVCNAATIEAAFVATVLQHSKQWHALQQRDNQPFPFPFPFPFSCSRWRTMERSSLTTAQGRRPSSSSSSSSSFFCTMYPLFCNVNSGVSTVHVAEQGSATPSPPPRAAAPSPSPSPSSSSCSALLHVSTVHVNSGDQLHC